MHPTEAGVYRHKGMSKYIKITNKSGSSGNLTPVIKCLNKCQSDPFWDSWDAHSSVLGLPHRDCVVERRRENHRVKMENGTCIT